MEYLGNVFTHYNYTTTDISKNVNGYEKIINSEKSNFNVVIDQTKGDVSLPKGSPFSDWKQARRFAGPLPFTFTYDVENKTVLIIEGVRQNWKPNPIKIKSYHFEFLKSLKLQNVILANAFEVTDVPYSWKKGRIEKWS